LIYDTLYAHQDKDDDKKLGLKSTALTFGSERTKPILYTSAALFFTGLCASGYAVDMGMPFYLGNAAATGYLGWIIKTADLDDPENLAYRFKANNQVGAIVTASVVAGTLF
jgi:4-hydroxybenzoate polyprenyltransferase